jgi:TRAP-type C4-dicarboxylate transport system permease small subunit
MLARLARVADGLALLGGAAVILLVAITFVSVIWRYLLNAPIYGIDDVGKMTLTVVVATSIAYGALRGAHVNVDLLDRFAGRPVTRWTDAVVRGLGACVVGFAAYGLFAKGACGFACGNQTADLAIPHLPFYMLLGLGFALYALILLAELGRGLAAWAAPRDPGTGA